MSSIIISDVLDSHSQEQWKVNREGFDGNGNYYRVCTEGLFGLNRSVVKRVDYIPENKQVEIYFNLSHKEYYYNHESGADVGKKYIIVNDGLHMISFCVPEENDYKEINEWIMKNKQFLGITRNYSGQMRYEGKDTIIVNDRIDGRNTCTHFWYIPKDEKFDFAITKIE